MCIQIAWVRHKTNKTFHTIANDSMVSVWFGPRSGFFQGGSSLGARRDAAAMITSMIPFSFTRRLPCERCVIDLIVIQSGMVS